MSPAAYRALRNFMPGLEALVTGQGSEVIVTDRIERERRLRTGARVDITGKID
jgi:hypothetical protein